MVIVFCTSATLYMAISAFYSFLYRYISLLLIFISLYQPFIHFYIAISAFYSFFNRHRLIIQGIGIVAVSLGKVATQCKQLIQSHTGPFKLPNTYFASGRGQTPEGGFHNGTASIVSSDPYVDYIDHQGITNYSVLAESYSR